MLLFLHLMPVRIENPNLLTQSAGAVEYTDWLVLSAWSMNIKTILLVHRISNECQVEFLWKVFKPNLNQPCLMMENLSLISISKLSDTRLQSKSFFFFSFLGWVKSFALFSSVLVCDAHITYPKQFKPWKVQVVVGSIVVVGALTRCALLHFMCNLKVALMNVYECKLPQNAAEVTKTFIVRTMKALLTSVRVARSSKPKAVDSSEAVLQAIEANSASSTLRVSGELESHYLITFITFWHGSCL